MPGAPDWHADSARRAPTSNAHCAGSLLEKLYILNSFDGLIHEPSCSVLNDDKAVDLKRALLLKANDNCWRPQALTFTFLK
ncbi:hypothetical protein PPC_3725 [Pseudomonas protegens Cab57]|nr:hypothetical protein PPC_3725 [Pseudomonas protegens Cab57]